MTDLAELAEELPVLEQVLRMSADSAQRSSLDAKAFFMVRIAALAATGATPATWMANLEAASQSGLTKEDVQGVLVAVSPVIGTARTMSAVGNAMRAIGLETALIYGD